MSPQTRLALLLVLNAALAFGSAFRYAELRADWSRHRAALVSYVMTQELP